MFEIDMFRNNPQTDPTLHIWGWEIPVYLFLGGLTAGLMILSALLHRQNPNLEARSPWSRWLVFGAPILISLGMLALWLDLENRFHVYRFYMAFRPTSPMSWGSWILLAIYPATLAMALGSLTAGEVDRLKKWGPISQFKLSKLVQWGYDTSKNHMNLLQHANLWLGVALGGYTGLLLGTLAARAVWNSVMLGPLFLVSGFSTGAALMMLFPLAHEEHAFLRKWDMGAIGVELALLFLFILNLLAGGGADGIQAAHLFLGGPYTAVFWSLVVITGLLVPLVIEGLETRKQGQPTLIAPALLLVGGLALRWILVWAGQA